MQVSLKKFSENTSVYNSSRRGLLRNQIYKAFMYDGSVTDSHKTWKNITRQL